MAKVRRWFIALALSVGLAGCGTSATELDGTEPRPGKTVVTLTPRATIQTGFVRASGYGDPNLPVEMARLSLSADGKRLALEGLHPDGNNIQIWDTSGSPTKVAEYEGREPVLSADGKRVAFFNSGAGTFGVRLADIGDKARTIAEAFPDWLAFGASGDLIGLFRDPGNGQSEPQKAEIAGLDPATGAKRFSFEIGRGDEQPWAGLAVDGGRRVVASYGATVLRVWEVPSGRLAQTLNIPVPTGANVRVAAASADGRLLAYLVSLNGLQVMRFPDGPVVCSVPYNLLSGVSTAAALVPGDRLLIYAGAVDKNLGQQARDAVAAEVTSGKPVAVFANHSQMVNAMAVSADGSTLATAGMEGSVKLWDLRGLK